MASSRAAFGVVEHRSREGQIDLEVFEPAARTTGAGAHVVDAALHVIVTEEGGREVHDVG